MLVTDIAYRDMEARAGGIAAWMLTLWRRALRKPLENGIGHAPLPASPPQLLLVPDVRADAPDPPSEDSDHLRWRRHPQLRSDPPVADVDLSRRAARSAAIQGLFLARGARFDEARAVFAIAAADHALDLTGIPGFWDLSRGGMLAAVGAYEEVGRFREAASLAARIRTRYRPRTVSGLPVVPARRPAHSGS